MTSFNKIHFIMYLTTIKYQVLESLHIEKLTEQFYSSLEEMT